MSLFGNLQQDEKIKESGDSLGGGGVRESGIDLFTIKAMYAGESSGGARSVTIEAVDAQGRNFKTTQYVTSGKAKGQLNYYENKAGERQYLPGFELVNAICLMTIDKPLTEANFEDKVLKLWSPEAKAEVPQQVPVCVEAIGKQVYLGVLKVRENKTAKNEATGNYDPINEERFTNELDRVFHYPSKCTVTEARAGQPAKFFDDWSARWEGKDKDKYKEVAGGTSGRPSAAAGGSTGAGKPSSLFG